MTIDIEGGPADYSTRAKAVPQLGKEKKIKRKWIGSTPWGGANQHRPQTNATPLGG